MPNNFPQNPFPKMFGLALLGLLIIGSVTGAKAYTGQELAKEAKVSLLNARSMALKSRPGKITDEELEKETGGSGLRYSFDIKTKAKTYEVGVDAKTGEILENKVEGKKPD